MWLLIACAVMGAVSLTPSVLKTQSVRPDTTTSAAKQRATARIKALRSVANYKSSTSGLLADKKLFDGVAIDEYSDTTIKITVGPEWENISEDYRKQLVSKLWFNWNEICVCENLNRGWVKFVTPSGQVLGRAGDNSGEFLVSR